MLSCLHPQHADALRKLRGVLSAWVLAACLAPIAATAQQPAKTGVVNTEGLPPELTKQLEEAIGGDPMARAKRMTDPNAGKRPGDEKLSCEQIRAEFEDNSKKADAQDAKSDAASAAAEAGSAQFAAETSGPRAIASSVFGGLAGLGAQLVGQGNVFNDKVAADLVAKHAKMAELNNRATQSDEAGKAISDRGERLMSLGKAKGCKALVQAP